MQTTDIPPTLLDRLRAGCVIPAHPLVLDAKRCLDETRQRGLTCYYLDSGAGGIAVAVHSTQFEIRRPGVGLLRPVLSLAAEVCREHEARTGRPVLRIAGVCGDTPQAEREAAQAVELGYHAGLLSLAAVAAQPLPDILAHCRRVAETIPLVGFYLQPAVGGRVLPYAFWREFAEIGNVVAIKIAPFNRYQTLDVVRAVCDAGRERDVVLYTGNDDNIVADLVTPFCVRTPRGETQVRIVGGILGQWGVWTRRAVEILGRIHAATRAGGPVPADLLTLGAQWTDANGAIFDAANGYAGCIPGIHEALRRQDLLVGTWCLNPRETLSPGQAEEIARVMRSYPDLLDPATR